MTEKPDQGLLDFAVICDTPLTKKETVLADGLAGIPLFTSRQDWEGDIKIWAGERFGQLRLKSSFRLAYNASFFCSSIAEKTIFPYDNSLPPCAQ